MEMWRNKAQQKCILHEIQSVPRTLLPGCRDGCHGYCYQCYQYWQSVQVQVTGWCWCMQRCNMSTVCEWSWSCNWLIVVPDKWASWVVMFTSSSSSQLSSSSFCTFYSPDFGPSGIILAWKMSRWQKPIFWMGDLGYTPPRHLFFQLAHQSKIM